VYQQGLLDAYVLFRASVVDLDRPLPRTAPGVCHIIGIEMIRDAVVQRFVK